MSKHQSRVMELIDKKQREQKEEKEALQEVTDVMTNRRSDLHNKDLTVDIDPDLHRAVKQSLVLNRVLTNSVNSRKGQFGPEHSPISKPKEVGSTKSRSSVLEQEGYTYRNNKLVKKASWQNIQQSSIDAADVEAVDP